MASAASASSVSSAGVGTSSEAGAIALAEESWEGGMLLVVAEAVALVVQMAVPETAAAPPFTPP